VSHRIAFFAILFANVMICTQAKVLWLKAIGVLLVTFDAGWAGEIVVKGITSVRRPAVFQGIGWVSGAVTQGFGYIVVAARFECSGFLWSSSQTLPVDRPVQSGLVSPRLPFVSGPLLDESAPLSQHPRWELTRLTLVVLDTHLTLVVFLELWYLVVAHHDGSAKDGPNWEFPGVSLCSEGELCRGGASTLVPQDGVLTIAQLILFGLCSRRRLSRVVPGVRGRLRAGRASG
jgi:hypothetical protein